MTWMLWALLSTFLWGTAGALSAVAARSGTAIGVWAGATMIEAMMVLPLVGKINGAWSWAMVGVGVTGGLAYGAFFLALKQPDAPVGPVVAVTALYPVVAALLAWAATGESLSLVQWFGVLLAVAACVLVAQG